MYVRCQRLLPEAVYRLFVTGHADWSKCCCRWRCRPIAATTAPVVIAVVAVVVMLGGGGADGVDTDELRSANFFYHFFLLCNMT